LRRVRQLAGLGALLACSGPAVAAEAPDARLLLLDGCVVGGDVIAVGERGTILRSSDSARTWRRTAGPVESTLTGISFATLSAPRLGWAVGHDAVILGSTDAGATWVKQHQGESLEDSFLDVLALDAQRAIAVGAYGLYLTTSNGGRNWTARKIIEGDDHLNRITRGPGSTLYLAGERGTLLRSPDLGETWTPLDTQYEGTFYGILPVERRVILAHGLRGRVFRSTDEGDSWEQVATPRPALLATAVRLRNNLLLVGGQAGSLLISRDLGRTLTLFPDGPGTGIAELLELPDGSVLALGEAGATRLDAAALLPSAAAPPLRSP
jgi:photosystem II stability/assembly factor-like uncharacterized protein